MQSVTAHNILVPSHAALVTNSGIRNLKMTRVSAEMPSYLVSRTLTFNDSPG